jgi:ribosomal protein S18 acetylase RimI-like enzyme
MNRPMGLKTEIESLLKQIDNDFVPSLSTRLVINEYAEKIQKNATIFSTHQGGELQAFIAVYCNDRSSLTAFMTILAVAQKHRNSGLASNLIESSIRFLKKLGFKTYRLEVYKSNTSAIKLYEKFNFMKVAETNTSIYLELHLDQDLIQKFPISTPKDHS